MNTVDIWEAAFNVTIEKMERATDKSFNWAREKLDAPRIAAAYRTKMMEWHGTTRILGNPNPMPLEKVFTDVYIFDEPEATRYLTIEEMEMAYGAGDSHRGLKRYDGVSVFQKYKRLFVLGKPGAGKTTFMRWITILSAKGKLEGIPIFITLKEMTETTRTVLEQIIYQFALCDIPNPQSFAEELLKSGKAIVLFDGLDEIPNESQRQEKIISDIRDFVVQYSKNHYLITSRTAALTYAFSHFKYVEIADFTMTQVKDYVAHYFAYNKKKANGFLSELQQEQHKKLQELATSPLLLSLFCLNYQQSGTFPAERVDLYEEALLALLTRWNGERNLRPKSLSPYGQLAPKRRTQLYSVLAYENFKRGSAFIKSGVLTTQVESFLQTVPNIPEVDLDGAKVLRDMEAQHGIIVERAKLIHSFSHLTFQEYYTAKYIVDNEASGTLDELMSHINDPRWREVFLLTASLLSQADIFFKKFLEMLDLQATLHTKIVDVLKYANARENYYPKLSPLEARWWNIYFERARARALDLTLAFTLARSLDLTLARTRVPQLALALNLNLDLDPDSVRELDLALALDISQSEALDLVVESLDPEFRVDIALWVLRCALAIPETLPLFTRHVSEASRILGQVELTEAIANIQLPQSDESPQLWEEFHNRITNLAMVNRELRLEGEFMQDEIKYMDRYLSATSLLSQCLNIAVVTDREGIKNRLLLPPIATPT